MDGMTDITKPPPRAQVVRRSEALMNSWVHIVDEDTDWTEALSRDYWGSVIEKFRAGDRVEIHSFDRRIIFEMRIFDVNTASNPHFFDIGFLPIWPAALQLPVPMPQRQPRYQVRMAPGGNFRIIDTTTGLPTHENAKSHHAAMEMASELERGLASATEAMRLADEFHQATERSVIVTPGAARTRRYRERQRSAVAPAGEAA
jgi:hypothetical protein